VLPVSNFQKQIKKVTAAESDWRKRKFRSHVVVVCYEFSDVHLGIRPTRLPACDIYYKTDAIFYAKIDRYFSGT
jgi:hypothetical protein